MSAADSGNSVTIWLKAVVALGVPAVISLYLVYQLSQGIQVSEADIRKAIDAHSQENNKNSQRQDSFLFAICLNTAGESNLSQTRCVAAFENHLTGPNEYGKTSSSAR